MMTIWKFPLDVTDEQLISMPSEAEILSLQVQSGIPCIWATVDSSRPAENRRFFTHGTGHNITRAHIGKFIGTYQIGSLVFHVFEVQA